jgi:hippurate hydrolase
MMERFGIDEVYAIHNSPGIEAGKFAIRPGPILASVDEFTLHLKGRGGHGAKPHMTVDTTVMMCHMISALQTIVSRNMDPIEKAVMTLTSAETSSKAFNVIPDRAEVRGTIRTHSEEVRAMIPKRIKEIAEGVAQTFGGSVEVEMRIGVPVTINDEAATEYAREAAEAVTSCEDVPILMGGEDFSFMLMERPGAMIRLGNGNSAGLHHPEYDFNDEIIPAGISWFAEVVERRMPAA